MNEVGPLNHGESFREGKCSSLSEARIRRAKAIVPDGMTVRESGLLLSHPGSAPGASRPLAPCSPSRRAESERLIIGSQGWSPLLCSGSLLGAVLPGRALLIGKLQAPERLHCCCIHTSQEAMPDVMEGGHHSLPGVHQPGLAHLHGMSATQERHKQYKPQHAECMYACWV